MFNLVVNTIQPPCTYNYGMDKFDPQEIGARIRQLREAKGLTQTQLGELCGVSKVAVSLWESGKTHNIRIPAWLSLYDVLGTTPEYLAYGYHRTGRGSSTRNSA